LQLTGEASGQAAEGLGAFLLTKTENTQRWYLGPALVSSQRGVWFRQVGIGNPVAQPKDREFTVCVYLLPLESVDELTSRLVDRQGGGLHAADLPQDRTQVACLAATRLRQP
jgi:hypothetical protein